MNIALEDKGLRLGLGSGDGYFNYYWLRDNDAGSIDPVTRERVFDISGLGEEPAPEEARIEGDALVIRWRGEGAESRYPLDWLESWQARGAPDAAAIPRRRGSPGPMTTGCACRNRRWTTTRPSAPAMPVP